MRRTALVLAILGLLILVVALISWAAFPAWRETPGGFLLLLAAAATGVVILVKGVLDILKRLRELGEEKEKPTPVQVEVKVEVPPTPTPTYPHPPSPPRHLRAPVPTFTGRARELEEIPARLSADGGGAALIAGLTGMGGVGKTELAYAVAHRLRETYPDGQLVVDLKGTTEPLPPQEALARMIHAFEPQARLPDDLPALQIHYRSLLAGKRALLLLDDAAGTAQVRPLLEVPEGVGVLVTSRRRLALPGLQRWDVDLLSLEQAVELLRKTAPGREDVDEATWERIAGLCGRLPLALRVAGATLETTPDLGDPEYTASLTDEKRRLSALRLEDDPQGDVGAVLGLSVARLEREYPEWAVRWTLLGLLPPAPFDTEIAAALWGHTAQTTPLPHVGGGGGDLPTLEPLAEEETRETLHALVRRNLLDWDGETRCYALHDLLRLYALGRAEERLDADEREAARLRHALHVLAGARRSEELYQRGSEDFLAGLVLLDDLLPHLQAAFAWAREGAAAGRQVEARLAILLPGVARHPLDLRLAPQEKIPWLEGAAAAARALGHKDAEGVHLGNLGLAWANLGEVRKAIDFYEQALTIAREIGDRRNEGAWMGNLGLAWADLGEVRKAIDFYEQALQIAREIGDRRGEGNRLGKLGLAWADLGEVRKAIDFYEQALDIAQEIGDRRNEGAWMGSLGLAWAALGEVRKAIDFYEQALAIARGIGDRRNEGAWMGNLGLAWADLGEVRKAIDFYERCLVIHREIGDRRGEGNDLGNLGIAYRRLGKVRKAIDFYEQALQIAREIGGRRAEGNTLCNLGLAWADLGEVRKAIDFYEQALDIAQEIGDRRGQGAGLGNLGIAYRRLGEVRKAIDHYEQALQIAREIGDRRAEGSHLGNLGIAWADLGEVRKAIDFYEQALVIAREIGNRRGEGNDLANMGQAYRKLGDLERARRLWQEALEIYEAIEDPHAKWVRRWLEESGR